MKTKTVFLILIGACLLAQTTVHALDFEELKRLLKEENTYNAKTFPKLKACISAVDAQATSETLGGVSLDSKTKDIKKLSGCKLQKGGVEMQESSGDTVWNFAACDFHVIHTQGYIVGMWIDEKSKLKLKSGIGIGSTLDEVKAKYPNLQAGEEYEGSYELAPKSCDMPETCQWDYSMMSIRIDAKTKKVIAISLQNYTSDYCAFD